MKNKKISIIGAPSDYGQLRRGVDMGPSAMRYAGVYERLDNIGYDVRDEGDILVKKGTSLSTAKDTNLKNLNEVIEVCTNLCTKVKEVIKQGRAPLVLGDWIIEECISDFAKWNGKHKIKDFLISINVSSLQFKNKNFVKYLISIIKKYNVSPSNIELEITESVFIDNMQEIIHKMKLLNRYLIV